MNDYYHLFDTYMTDLARIDAVIALEGSPIKKSLTRQQYSGNIFWRGKCFRATFIKYRSGNIQITGISQDDCLEDFLTVLNEHMENRLAFLWFRKFSSYLYTIASIAFSALFFLFIFTQNIKGIWGTIVILILLRIFYIFCRNRIK